MSNKLRKKIKCCLCEKEVPITDKCRRLFDRDVCPDCAVRVAGIVNKLIDEKMEG
jgi:hypothetical protein